MYRYGSSHFLFPLVDSYGSVLRIVANTPICWYSSFQSSMDGGYRLDFVLSHYFTYGIDMILQHALLFWILLFLLRLNIFKGVIYVIRKSKLVIF